MISLDDKMRTGLAWQEEQECKVCFSGIRMTFLKKCRLTLKTLHYL